MCFLLPCCKLGHCCSDSLPAPLPFPHPGIPTSRQNLKRFPMKQTLWIGKPCANISDLTLPTLLLRIRWTHLPFLQSQDPSPFTALHFLQASGIQAQLHPSFPSTLVQEGYFHLAGLCSTHLWSTPPRTPLPCSPNTDSPAFGGSTDWYKPYRGPCGNTLQDQKCTCLWTQ